MTTVFLLAGVAGDPAAVAPLLNHAYTAPSYGNTIVPVTYPNLLPPYDPGIQTGAATLNDLLTSTPGKKVVKAHSLACLVAGYWMRHYGPTSGIPAADLEFLLMGNSVRRFNGYYPLNNFSLPGLPNFVSPDNMTPPDTIYPVRDVAVRGDGWADWPNDPNNFDAVAFALEGQGTIHVPGYMTPPLRRADYAEFTPPKPGGGPGHVTFVTIPLGLDGSAKTARIEAGYQRPAPFVSLAAARDVSTFTGSAGRVGADPKRDTVAAWNTIESRRKVLDAEAKSPSLYRLWDKSMKYIGTVRTHKKFDGELMQHDTGEGEVVLRGSDWLVNFVRTDVRAAEDLNFTVDPYPHRRSWRTRLGFKVIDVIVGRAEDGEVTVTLKLMENREHWKHILFGATIFAPPEAQPLKAWLLPGNCRTVTAATGAMNLARLFNPALAIFTNLLNPGAYVGAALGAPNNFNVMNWPIQMQFVNPIFDTSRSTVLMSRWQKAHDVTEQMLRDAGCHVRTYVFLKGEDTESPHPELELLVGKEASMPTRNCIIIACEERAEYAGITGLAPDGAIKLLTATADDLITEQLFAEYDENGDGITDPLIRKWFGASAKKPSIVFRDGPRSAIVSAEHHMFKAKAKHLMTGGKSPSWLNQVQTFLIRYAISKIAEAILSFPTPGAPAQLTGTEGIENVYQNQADDTLFAFIRYTDINRELSSGDMGLLEEFVQGSGSAYVIATPLTIRQGIDQTKPRHAFKVEVRNARPHRIFLDVDLGDPALFEIDGILTQDHVSAIRLTEDENTPKTFAISIGDDRETEGGLARATRDAARFWNGLATLMGSESMF